MKNFAMTNDDVTLLEQKLIIPSAVSDIIQHNLNVGEEMEYNLHMALSEIDPDSALLAIALCARAIAEKHINEAPIASALSVEANNIIDEYAPTWLRYQKGSPMPSEQYASILQTVPEDLEALADLLDALAADLEETDKVTEGYLALANVFVIQARAHMEIASFVLEEIDSEQEIPAEPISMAPKVAEQATAGDNIILFPGGKH